jgi:hypothetical protein
MDMDIEYHGVRRERADSVPRAGWDTYLERAARTTVAAEGMGWGRE